MAKTTLALKSTVTRRDSPPPLASDMKTRLENLQQQQPVVAVKPKGPNPNENPPKADKPRVDPHGSQSAFLIANHGKRVAIKLIDGSELIGTLREFDTYTVLLDDADGPALLMKHAMTLIRPKP